MRTADPATPTWTMTDPEGVAAFWLRRAGHETTVHRVDVQQAAGVTVAPVPADRAVDGVGGFLLEPRPGRLVGLGGRARHRAPPRHRCRR